MSFLAPLFFLGALAITLPILFHLIRRTTREKVPFSSLMFLRPSLPRMTRRSRLEHIFLLLLRCAVLGLLAAGFARPFLQKPAVADPTADATRHVVLLLDTSASMRRASLWRDARAKAEAWLQKTTPGDRVAMLTFDRDTRSLLSFEQWNAVPWSERVPMALQRLQTPQPQWAHTRLGPALIAALELFQEIEAESATMISRQILVISDLQAGAKLDGLQGLDWPEGVRVILDPVSAPPAANASLQFVPSPAEAAASNAAPNLRVRVSNNPDSGKEQFQLRWHNLDGQPSDAPATEIYVPPGQSRITQLALPSRFPIAAQLRLTGDDEAFDNLIYVMPPSPESRHVAFLGSDALNDPRGLLYYLRRAFPETRQLEVKIEVYAPESPLAPAQLEGVSLAILAGSPPPQQVPALRALLQSGKAILLLLRQPSDAAVLKDVSDLSSPTVEEATIAQYTMLTQIQFSHPIFQPFADPRYGDFTKIHFWKHRRLATNELPQATVLARFDDGDPALLQVPAGRGSLLVLTAGWHPVDSQLALSSKFVPLLHAILEWSGGPSTGTRHFAVGDGISSPSQSSGGAWRVRKPDGTETNLAGQDRFLQTDAPGLYTFTSGTVTQRFAVNLASEEGRTTPMPVEDLERLNVPLQIAGDAPSREQQANLKHLQAAELENRQKLWRWLIAAALVFILGETWLGGRLSRT